MTKWEKCLITIIVIALLGAVSFLILAMTTGMTIDVDYQSPLKIQHRIEERVECIEKKVDKLIDLVEDIAP